jgi:basic membrane lipoprotein Med (substrate-binding protein (PBP1-ABC) superfamily)
MMTATLRDKVVKEINLIPEEKLPEILDFLYHFRLGVQILKSEANNKSDFAGRWQDMPDEIYHDFINDVARRRRSAFSTK